MQHRNSIAALWPSRLAVDGCLRGRPSSLPEPLRQDAPVQAVAGIERHDGIDAGVLLDLDDPALRDLLVDLALRERDARITARFAQ